MAGSLGLIDTDPLRPMRPITGPLPLPSWMTGEGAAAPEYCTKSLGALPTIVITSTSSPYVTGLEARKWDKSIWSSYGDSGLKYIPLWVYNENTWDTLHGRPALQQSALPRADCFIDVFDTAPGLLDLVTTVDSKIEQVYGIRGVHGLSPDIMDGKALIRKVLAGFGPIAAQSQRNHRAQ
jgi:hypothetical protein